LRQTDGRKWRNKAKSRVKVWNYFDKKKEKGGEPGEKEGKKAK